MSRADTGARAPALVTGASRGIGRALALELARRGHRVIAAARSRDKLEDLVSEIAGRGGEAIALELDVANTEQAVRTIRDLDEAEGGLGVVIANAGVGEAKIGEPSFAWETVRHALHTNFCGAVATLTAALPRMIARGRGHLVGIGSLASYGALPGALAYCAPKAGLKMALECLALDAAGTGVAVTHVELGFVRTDMVATSTHAMPQMVEPDVAARVIVERLARRPRTIVFPRALALATRGLAALPAPIREAVAKRSRPR
jgi:short-subunit dehydrogenase